MKPRLLFLTPGLGLGGAEHWVIHLCRYLREFDIAGVWPVSGACHPDLVASMRQLEVPIIVPGERLDADIILSWGIPDPRKRLGPTNKPLVVVSHGVWPDAPDGYFEAQAWQATHIAAVSQTAAGAFGPRYSKYATVLYNGADENRLTLTNPPGHYRSAWGIEENQPVVLQIGRLDKEKRPDCLLKAAKFLPKEWVIVFVGDGALRAECVREAKQTHRRVVFQSPVPNIGDIYDAADVVCMTSSREGMPLVMLESWLADVPVVATDFPFVGEMIEKHGDILSVVPQEHEPIMLAAAITIAAHDRGMAVRAKQVAEVEYTAKAMAERWDKYLLGALGGGK